jgi:hypothetical protein
MAITATDWEVDRSTKVISYTGDDHDGSLPSYATVIELHRWLGTLADDPYSTPSTNDHVDISALLPSDRSTDNIITLLNGYTLDARAPEHLFDGSIIESGGDTIYDGIVNYGNTSVQIQIMQNGAVLSDDWWNYNGAGLNPDAGQGISHRFMLKVRDQGVDIDGRKLLGVCRTFNSTDGYTFSEFPINGSSRGNNVLALADSDDINNDTAVATVAGWTTITNTEGLRLIDVDNDGTDEEYWSEWNKAAYTINQFYERMKWISKSPIAEDSCVDSGSNFVVDDATITGAAQSFTVGSNAMLVTKISVNLKIGAGTPTGDVIASIYSHNGTYGTSSVPNALQGSASDPVEAGTIIDSTNYETTTFHFPTPVSLTASTNYVLVIEHANGGAADYLHVEGLATTGTHGGNRSHNTAGWTAVATDDLAFVVYTSAQINGIPGILMRGVTHSMPYDLETGAPAITTNDEIVWGTNIYCPTNSGTFLVGEAVHEDTATPTWKGRVLAWDPTNDYLMIYLDSGTVTATDTFTGQDSSATGTVTSKEDPQAGSIGGMLRVYAFDDDGAAGNIYGQLMKGGAPKDNDKVYDATDLTDSYTLSADATSRAVSTPFCGSSTGSSIIGSYGFGIEYADLTNADKIVALDGVTYTPPNNVTNSVSGLETTGSNEDYVRVAPWDGSSYDTNGDPAVNTNQMLLNTALTTNDITSVVVKNGDETAIPSDTPSAGWLRVVDDNGYHRRLKYSSWTGTTFTIDDTWHTANDSQNDFASVNASVDSHVYITYLDEVSTTTPMTYTGVYSSDRDLVVVVRNGNDGYLIKQFIAEWSFTNTAQTINAIHTSDT